MTLSPGARVGPYEILSTLGSGGMGQVYLARDERLAREVALKVLPEDVSSDPARLRRFENEARAASALNHPNIVTIYDVGTSGPIAWIAMERVDGKTVRDLLSRDGLPVRKLLPIATQIAEGLATAHEAGIVHRDLKPENVMVTKEGLVKVLDFGVAKLAPTGSDGSAGRPPAETATFPGTVVGTIAYMSPEQAAGQPLDFRSDQFSFGSLLYEMATGKRAFQGKSAVDTLAAVLKENPRPIAELSPSTPAPLRWIVERCLAKDPGRRYASTRDLARDLETLRDHSSDTSGSALVSTPRPRRLRVATLLTTATLLAGFVGIFLAGRRSGERPVPDFQRLTFRRGSVASARFAPDGRTIVYGAAWDGEPIRLFSTRTDGRESRRLDLPDGDLASVSSLGEIAMLAGDPWNAVPEWTGTLARVPLTGGAPRKMSEGVRGADWSLDGKSLVVVRDHEGKWRIEFPIGKVLYETEELISSPRLSPRGDRIAFWTSVDLSNATVETVDLAGKHNVLAGPWKRGGGGLAWSPDGKEVWFSANRGGWQSPLYAVTPSGKMRVVTRLPSWIELRDIAHDGRVLLALTRLHSDLRGVAPGETQERDLSWHEGSLVKGLTPDGKTMLFDEEAEGDFHAIYVRPTDGSPATRIGEGRSLAISPDGQWVAANAQGRGSAVVLLPTGPGEPRALDAAGEGVQEAQFFPDGKRLLIDGKGVLDLQTGKVSAGAPEGATCQAFSPAGTEMACVGSAGEGVIWTLEGGALRPIPGFLPGESIMQWSSDGRSLYVSQLDIVPMRVFRLDLTTGKRELWREFRPTDSAALLTWSYYFAMTPDARTYAYSSLNLPSDLYLVTGLE